MSFTFEPIDDEAKKQWVKDYLGASFVKGIAIGKYTARVIAKTDDGEKEVLISLPRKIVNT
jgi:hypothetical protein